MFDIIREQFMNPNSNPFLQAFELGCINNYDEVVPILSFPRSRNGWIRHLLAAYLISKHIGLSCSEIHKLDRVTIYPGVQGISVDGKTIYPVDLIIPDVYYLLDGRYKQLMELETAAQCIDICGTLTHKLIKSHHIAHEMHQFKVVVGLVRPPLESITSAGFLLFQGLNALNSSEQKRYAKIMTCHYNEYFKRYNDIANERPMIFIDTSNPCIGIARLLSYLGYFDSEDIIRVFAIYDRFPAETGFPKKTEFEQYVEIECSSYDLNSAYEWRRI